MQEKNSLGRLLLRLWAYISPPRRMQFYFLLLLMVISSFSEMLSIGAVIPFLGIFTAPDKIFELQKMQPFINYFHITTPQDLLIPISLVFGFLILISGILRLILLWISTKLAYLAGADISFGIYQKTLYQPYDVHIERNSSEIINAISSKANTAVANITAVLNIISSIFTLLIILIAMVVMHIFIPLMAFGFFGVIYWFITRLSKHRLMEDGRQVANQSTYVIKSLQEGLGGIRDILLDGTQAVYCETYRKADIALRSAQSSIPFIAQAPRYGMETFGILAIIFAACVFASKSDGVMQAIPILGALALGAQRLLPVLQQTYIGMTALRSGQASLEDTLKLLEQPLPEPINKSALQGFAFHHTITLHNIYFHYASDSSWVLKDIELRIDKGSRVGFIGKTGSGKSTLLDLIMALLLPTKGHLEIDGQKVSQINKAAWQGRIAHVPQSIYLADTTVLENIAFGIPLNEIDVERAKEAARQAQIDEIIERWPKKYETFVGERGVRLSGGQRQRIAIARALYKKADVIVFDEATSALDNETEGDVMQVIDSLGPTITLLIAAHRLSTLKGCNQIIELSQGEITRSGTYEEIVGIN